MKISRAWMCDHVSLPAHVDARRLAYDVTLKTVEVEHVEDVDGDIVLVIDNKSLTNRPDLWGHAGMARELSAIYGLQFTPTPRAPLPTATKGLVELDDVQLCRRFAAVSFDLPHPIETPAWMAERLRRVGEYVGLFLVDLSNYVMLATGQPNHVYDRQTLALPLTVGVGDTDSYELLTGVHVDTRGLSVVRDQESTVGLAGVMGGSATAVQADTVRGLLEVASFPAMAVRRASQRVGVRTEASSRYEKALDTQRVDEAIGLFLTLLRREAPDVVVHGIDDVVLEKTERTSVVTPRSFLETRIGESLPDNEIHSTLESLGFDVHLDETAVHTVSPTWRSTGDISVPHDILEEVARIHGYDQLPATNVDVTLRKVRSLGRISLERLVRESLTLYGGLQEVVTYPWVTDAALAACGLSADQTITYEGAPSPDRSQLRSSLLPNLLECVASNLQHATSFGIVELGTVFTAVDLNQREPDGTVPGQSKEVGAVIVGSDGVEVFRRLRYLVDVLRAQGRVVSLGLGGPAAQPWADPSARVTLVADGSEVGAMALIRPRVLRDSGITGVQVGYLTLRLEGLSIHSSRDNTFVHVPALPVSRFDLSILVSAETAWADVQACVSEVDDVTEVEYLGDFRGSWVPEGHKSLSLRVTITPLEHTFSAEDISARRDMAIAMLGNTLGATLRTV